MGFSIRTNDGTQYTFGGDQSSTDFTYNINSHPSTTRYKGLSPMGWHLTQITHVSGKQINFAYQKDAYSLVLNTTNSVGYTSVSWSPAVFPSFTTSYSGNILEYSYTVLRNSYLTEIQTPYEVLKFEKSLITDADAAQYPFKLDANNVALRNAFDWHKNKWFKLNSIKTYSKDLSTVLKHTVLEYVKSPSSRLQLKKIRQVDVSQIDYTATTSPTYDATNSIPIADFEYDQTPLPAYGTGLIDHWGYYTDNGGMLHTGQSNQYAKREPSASKMGAEVLKQVNYPTGGYTAFEFEPHDYYAYIPKPADVNYTGNTAILPINNTNQLVKEIAGGLRIKKITSSPDGGVTTLEKTYKYVKNYGVSGPSYSTGILSGKPKYFDQYVGSFQFPATLVPNPFLCPSCPPRTVAGTLTFNNYYYMTEQSLNLLNLTNGSPVTYSEVVEVNKDNSYTIYKFSNYDNSNYCDRKALKAKTLNNTTVISPSSDPIIDYGTLRGKLVEQKLYNSSNQPVSKTVNEYTTTLDEATAIRAIRSQWVVIKFNAQELRASSYLIHTSPVFLTKTTVTSYFDNPAAPQTPLEVSTITENTYDIWKNITRQEVRHLNNTEIKSNVTTTYAYAYDPVTNIALIPNPDVSETVTDARGGKQHMLDAFMIGIPLETKNNFNQGSKVEFKKFTVPGIFDNGGTPINTITESILPFIYYSQNKDATFTEQFRINSYKDYDRPTETKEKGTNTPVVTYDWEAAFLKTKVFGTGTNQLTWTYNYDYTKRLLTDKTDENGLRMKFTYDGYRRLSGVIDRFDGTAAIPANRQSTISYDYHYKGQATNVANDVNRNFVTTSTFVNLVYAPALQTKQYLDGLGRPFMTYRSQYTQNTAAPHQKSYTTYDDLGRVSRVYQPTANNVLGVDATIPATDFRSMTYEPSPLSRVLFQTTEDNKTIRMEYGTNKSIATEGVWKINVTYDASNVRTVALGNYNMDNTLYRITSWDENNTPDLKRGRTDIFKDKLDRVILTRKYVKDANGVYQNVDTYNVYDTYGDLVMVIPPGAIDPNSWIINKALVFEYTYNNERQLVEKKVPNADAVKYYYNNKYLPTLVQDGNMRVANKYLATVYDEIGRAIKTGFVTSNDPNNITISDAVNEPNRLTRTVYYQNTNWVKDQEAKVLKYEGVGFQPTTIRNHLWSYIERRAGYTYTGNPIWTGKQHLLSKTYIDGWNEVANDAPITDNDYGGVDWSVSAYDGLQKPTLSIRYLFSGPSWERDKEVRQCQTFTYDNGQRLMQTNYDYALQGAGINVSPPFILSNMTYNERDLLTKKKTANINNKYLQSTDFAYNKRNWLTSINSGFSNSSLDYPLFSAANSGINGYYSSLTYGANTPLPNAGEDNPDLFKEIIRYDNPIYTIPGNTPPQYNGNISQIEYQVAGYEAQAYSFGYDNLDRLTTANYADSHSDNAVGSGKPWATKYETDLKFQETASYDLRGNIQTLTRKGTSAMPQYFSNTGLMYGTFGDIDNLAYRYDPADRNKLLAVTDNSNNLERGFKAEYGNNPSTTDDYTYDQNGNVTSDLNKGISLIEYNYLNLPTHINFLVYTSGSTKDIYFIYDASGQKHRKIVRQVDCGLAGCTTTETTYDYVNGTEYKVGKLQRIAHTEGSVSLQSDGSTYKHEYVINDHLGNARVTFSNDNGTITVADIKQVNHYYGFGLNMEGNWNGADGKNKYQFNGKEWNDDFGLGWNDYGFRFYDPAIGRFPSVDPIIEQFSELTPYNYASNSPVTKIDLWGLQGLDANMFKNMLWKEAGVTSPEKGTEMATTIAKDVAVGTAIMLGTMILQEAAVVAFTELLGGAALSETLVASTGLKAASTEVKAVAAETKVVTAEAKSSLPHLTEGKPRGANTERVSSTNGASSKEALENVGNKGKGGKGERNLTAKSDGTNNPFKKMKPDPNNPKKVLTKDANGKEINKPKPEGFDDYWKTKH